MSRMLRVFEGQRGGGEGREGKGENSVKKLLDLGEMKHG